MASFKNAFMKMEKQMLWESIKNMLSKSLEEIKQLSSSLLRIPYCGF